MKVFSGILIGYIDRVDAITKKLKSNMNIILSLPSLPSNTVVTGVTKTVSVGSRWEAIGHKY